MRMFMLLRRGGYSERRRVTDTHMGDAEYPGTGSGGLADGSGVSAGLIGLLIALSVAAVAGLGLRRVRNRP